MKDLYYNKYLKYKSKYLNLKNMFGGAPNKRLIVESKRMIESGKYKLVNLNVEENTVYITLKDDRIIKIKVKDNYPFSPPIICHEDKCINQKILNFEPSIKLEKYLDNFDDYPLTDYKEIPYFNYYETYTTRKISGKKYVKLITVGDYIEGFDEIYINLENDTIVNGKTLLDAIENLYVKLNGCLIKNLKYSYKKIMEISDEDFENMKSEYGLPLIINITKIKKVSEFLEDMQKHTDISIISKLKPVATNKSGSEPSNFLYNWNLYNDNQKKMILETMSKFLSDKNGYDIKFNIKSNDKADNIMIYYSENYLNKLSKLFDHESIEKSLDLISVFNKDNLDFIYIAFGDIDITKLQKLDDLSENGKRIYDEYMK